MTKKTVDKQKKIKDIKAEHWPELVQTYFDFCKKEFGDSPSFDGSSPRDFKVLVESLKSRHEGKGRTWTKEAAVEKLYSFLAYCKKDKWLSENFLPANLNRQKDKIFFKLAQESRVKSNTYLEQVEQAKNNFKPVE